jgi:hypothetical protein
MAFLLSNADGSGLLYRQLDQMPGATAGIRTRGIMPTEQEIATAEFDGETGERLEPAPVPTVHRPRISSTIVEAQQSIDAKLDQVIALVKGNGSSAPTAEDGDSVERVRFEAEEESLPTEASEPDPTAGPAENGEGEFNKPVYRPFGHPSSRRRRQGVSVG